MELQTPDVVAKIRGIQAEKRATQAQLAKVLHVSKMAITRRFNGSVPFNADELIVLSRFFNVPVGAFFGEHSSSPATPMVPSVDSSPGSAGGTSFAA